MHPHNARWPALPPKWANCATRRSHEPRDPLRPRLVSPTKVSLIGCAAPRDSPHPALLFCHARALAKALKGVAEGRGVCAACRRDGRHARPPRPPRRRWARSATPRAHGRVRGPPICARAGAARRVPRLCACRARLVAAGGALGSARPGARAPPRGGRRQRPMPLLEANSVGGPRRGRPEGQALCTVKLWSGWIPSG